MSARLLPILLALVGSAYIADLFLRWGPIEYGADGIYVRLGGLSFASALALVLWELSQALRIRRRGRFDALVAFFLASLTALTGIGIFVNLRWGGLPVYHGTGYGAWIGLALAALLFMAGLAHLLEQPRETESSSFERVASASLAVIGASYVGSLFLPWGPRFEVQPLVPHGLDVLPTELGFLSAVTLVLWEALGVVKVQRTSGFDALVAAFLAAGTAGIGGAAILELNGGFTHNHGLFYGAWIALPLAVILLGISSVILLQEVRARRSST